MRNLALGAALLALLACSADTTPPPAEPVAEVKVPATPTVAAAATEVVQPSGVATARTLLSPTEGNTANGELMLVAEGDSLRISGTLRGLAPNTEHGFHIHETGDCSAPDASSAGPHFNPDNHPHGNPDAPPHHAGDMLNLMSDADGIAPVNEHVSNVSLGDGSSHDVMGRALVLHQKQDDYVSQPAGDSGPRIACGVILE